MSDNSYTLDGDYPAPGKRVTNKVGWLECDKDGDKWLTHNKIIIKGSASETVEEQDK